MPLQAMEEQRFQFESLHSPYLPQIGTSLGRIESERLHEVLMLDLDY